MSVIERNVVGQNFVYYHNVFNLETTNTQNHIPITLLYTKLGRAFYGTKIVLQHPAVLYLSSLGDKQAWKRFVATVL